LVNANIYSIAANDVLFNIIRAVIELLSLGVALNISLAVFNLFPIPPLDGSKVLYMFLPPNIYFKVLQYEQYITYGFFLFLMLESFLPVSIISPIVSFVSGKLIDLFNLILFF
jgi:Zn-dependent protease